MLGYLPSPFIYGLIADTGNARVAMGALMSVPMLATLMMWIGCYIIIRDDLLPKVIEPQTTQTNQRKSSISQTSNNKS